MYSLTMISLFNLAFGFAAGFKSPWPLWKYDGLVTMSRRLYVGAPSQAERIAKVGGIFNKFPRQPQLLQNNRLCMETLGLLTARLFPFLVGRCHVEPWDRTDGGVGAAAGEVWQSKVVIERCRFLEEGACKGMCTGLCKEPSEHFFASIGLPVSLTPNFEDGSCAMVWGRTPQQSDLDDQDMACYRMCDVMSAAATSIAVPAPATAAAPAATTTLAAAAARAPPVVFDAYRSRSPSLAMSSKGVEDAESNQRLLAALFGEEASPPMQTPAESAARLPAPGQLRATMPSPKAIRSPAPLLFDNDLSSAAGPPTEPPSAASPSDADGTPPELRVEIRSAGPKGEGAYAAEGARVGQWISPYVGDLVTLLQTTQRYREMDPEYLFQITPDLYIDGMDSSHASRYFNHHEDGNLNFTVDKTTNRVDFYAARDIAVGDELCFDYGMAYWAGSGIVPFNDSRNYTALLPSVRFPPRGPPPLTPTQSRAELTALMALPDEEARAGLLRCLEYFGAARLDTHAMRVPFGLGADAPSEVVDLRQVATGRLEEAARACIDQAAALAGQKRKAGVDV